jgi:hypothetical protein
MITNVFDGTNKSEDQKLLPINSIDDFRDIICYKSTCKFIITPNLWIGNDNTYGIKFMMQAVNVMEFSNSNNSIKNNSNLKYNWGDSSSSNSTKQVLEIKPNKVESDSESDSDNSNDSNNNIKFKSKINNSDDSDNNTNNKSLKTRIINSDDESDAEDIKPKKPVPKNKSKSTK